MSTATDIRHLTDAELVGILDGGEDAPAGRRAAHLETCDRCVDALDALNADSRLVRRFLQIADFEEGGRARPDDAAVRAVASAARTRGRSGWFRVALSPAWKAAAILVLVAGPLAAFPGVRSWVVERVTGTVGEPAAPARDMADEGPTIIRFTPDPGDFVVEFAPGTAGTIAVFRGSGPEAELWTSTGAPETVVSSSSLQIGNTAVARYELRLPAGVTGVWVRRGARAVALSQAQIERRAVVQLTRTGPPLTIRRGDQSDR